MLPLSHTLLTIARPLTISNGVEQVTAQLYSLLAFGLLACRESTLSAPLLSDKQFEACCCVAVSQQMRHPLFSQPASLTQPQHRV